MRVLTIALAAAGCMLLAEDSEAGRRHGRGARHAQPGACCNPDPCCQITHDPCAQTYGASYRQSYDSGEYYGNAACGYENRAGYNQTYPQGSGHSVGYPSNAPTPANPSPGYVHPAGSGGATAQRSNQNELQRAPELPSDSRQPRDDKSAPLFDRE